VNACSPSFQWPLSSGRKVPVLWCRDLWIEISDPRSAPGIGPARVMSNASGCPLPINQHGRNCASKYAEEVTRAVGPRVYQEWDLNSGWEEIGPVLVVAGRDTFVGRSSSLRYSSPRSDPPAFAASLPRWIRGAAAFRAAHANIFASKSERGR
jgi:hypothetical protein